MKKIRLKNYLLLLTTCSSVLFFAGCGYTLRNSGNSLPPDVQKIYIPIVQNDTTEGFVSQLLTENLRDEFDKYGAVQVVDSASDADATLEIRLTGVKNNTRSVTSRTDLALQSDVAITVNGVLRKNNGQLLWQNTALTLTKSYGNAQGGVVTSSSEFAGGIISARDLANLDPRQFARSQQQNALEGLADLAAQSIYTQAVAPDF